MLTKKCSACKQNLDLGQFCKDKKSKDGLNYKCRNCSKKYKEKYKKTTKSKFRELFEQGLKHCGICNRTLSLAEFHKNKAVCTGYCSKCKECANSYAKKKTAEKPKRPIKLKIIKEIAPEPPEGFKKCASCKEILDRKCFYVSNSSGSGLSSSCKSCHGLFRIKDPEKKKLAIEKRSKINETGHRVKTCYLCKKELELNDFWSDSKKIDGLSDECQTCKKELISDRNRHWDWASKSINSHKTSDVICLFSVADLAERARNTSNCEFCGIPLAWCKGNKKPVPTSPSLENLYLLNEISEKDCRIICYKCNTAKSNRTLNEYIQYLNVILPNLTKIQSE